MKMNQTATHTPGPRVSPAQKRMLRHLDRWGEVGPDAEDEVGLHGAAFEAVIAAVERKGLLRQAPGPVSGCWELSDEGRAAIAKAEAK